VPTDQLEQDVAQIRKDVDSILHGNGRRGLWDLSDAIFGHKDKSEPGIQARVKALEASAAQRANERKVTSAYQRGIAIGLALVAGNTFFGVQLNIPDIITRLLAR